MAVEVRFHQQAEDSLFRFAVTVAVYAGCIVFCRHESHAGYELPGGRREPGEDIRRTAERELWEESGATEFTMQPVTAYSVRNGEVETYGMLYYAEITRFGVLPPFEITTVELFPPTALPMEYTYPLIQPLLVEKVLQWRQAKADGDGCGC